MEIFMHERAVYAMKNWRTTNPSAWNHVPSFSRLSWFLFYFIEKVECMGTREWVAYISHKSRVQALP